MAQVGEPPIWVLEQGHLSAADSRWSSFGPCVVPLVTSFLISELATFVNDLFGGDWGAMGKEKEERNDHLVTHKHYSSQAQTPGISKAHR